MIAALFVETGGVYYGLPDVDPWDEERDARLYDGPWPVVAHPPCSRWCQFIGQMGFRHGIKLGDDGGCFESALRSVREFGGVLEHPAKSYAWRAFQLVKPERGRWVPGLFGGYVTEVSQIAYGHRARKPTWLYYHGKSKPSALRWSDGTGVPWPVLSKQERNATPIPFRDLLLDIARSAADGR